MNTTVEKILRFLAKLVCAVLLLMAVSGRAQNLFVASYYSGSLAEIAPNRVQSPFSSELSEPFGLAFNKTGALFVVNSGANDIIEITPGGASSVFATNLYFPTGAAFDTSGNLFVAYPMLNNIYEFTNWSGTLNPTPGLYASGLYGPLALAFDRSNNLFVACYDNIIEISPNGTQSTFVSGMQFCSGVAFDGNGNLFAADQTGAPGASLILEFTNYAGTLSANETVFASGLNQPWGLAFDSTGNLFEPDQGSGNVYEFTPAGLQSTFISGFNMPEGLAFEPSAELQGAVTNGVFQLTVTMPSPYYSTVVQASTDLVHWSAIYTNTPPFTFTNSISAVLPHRFYRAVLGP